VQQTNRDSQTFVFKNGNASHKHLQFFYYFFREMHLQVFEKKIFTLYFD